MDADYLVLRTGEEVHRGLLLTTSVALRHLFESTPTAFYDAVVWARTGQPQTFSQERIEAVGLAADGVMHESTAAVIRASADGDGFNMKLVNPLLGGS